jgi:hypothetical protein
MAKINFGGVQEDIITAEEFSLKKAREVLKNEVVAVLGYGVQSLQYERQWHQYNNRTGQGR